MLGASSINTNVNGSNAASTLARLNAPKRDFFGRIIIGKPVEKDKNDSGSKGVTGRKRAKDTEDEEAKVWLSFHEGFSNAVRKGISMRELLSGL